MPDDRSATQLGFILSTGRTGTKAIAHHLDGCAPGVVARHEPGFSGILGITSNLYLCGRINRRQLAWMLRRTRGKQFPTPDTRLFVESNPFLHGFIDVLDEVLGQPLVIHVVRHPGTYITSALDWGSYSGSRGAASNFFPYWVLKPELLEERPTRTRREMTDAEWLAWRWATANRYLNRGQELFGDRYLRIRFEDVIDPERGGMQEVVRWLGLGDVVPASRATELPRINASEQRGNLRHSDWPPELRARVLESCGDLIDLYGYDL